MEPAELLLDPMERRREDAAEEEEEAEEEVAGATPEGEGVVVDAVLRLVSIFRAVTASGSAPACSSSLITLMFCWGGGGDCFFNR